MKYNVALLLVVSLSAALAFGPSIHPSENPVIAKTKLNNRLPSLFIPQNVAKPALSPMTSSNIVATHTPEKVLVPAQTLRKKWGVDNEYPDEYWFDERIHTLGNNGFWGAVHAALAPLSTKIIDVYAYHGLDVRQILAQELSTIVGKHKARVVDLCCGVGISTRALQHAFPDAETILGIDTSSEMVAMADFLTKHLALLKPFLGSKASEMTESYKVMKKKGYALKRAAVFKAIRFAKSNAEDTKLPDKSFDLVTVMWAFHEAPMKGRDKILKEARRLLTPGGTLAVVDISTDYVPTETMLQGEPYMKEYQQNIHNQLQKFQGFHGAEYRTIVPNHLGMWTLTRSAIA